MTLDSRTRPSLSLTTSLVSPWCTRLALAVGVLLSQEAAAVAEPTASPDSTELDAETRTMARELALQGAAAFEQGDYTTALDRFDRAVSLLRVPSLTIMQARCLSRLSRDIEALDRYEETSRFPLAADAPEAYQQAVTDAKREGASLRLQIPQITLRVVSKAPLPPEFRVELDGKAVPPALLDVRRPINPGSHQVRVSAPQYETVIRQLTVEAGSSQLVVLALEKTPTAPSPLAPRDVAPTRESPTTRDDNTRLSPVWGYVAFGVGAVGTGVGVITGIIALDKKSSLDKVCDGGCPPDRQGDIDSFRSNRTLSYVGFGVGILGAGIGTYLVLSGSRQSPAVALHLGPEQAQIAGVF